MANYKKFCSFLRVGVLSLSASSEGENKKGFFGYNRWRFSKKAKCLVTFAIIATILISAFSFLPKQSISKDNNDPQSTDSPLVSPSPNATEVAKKTGTGSVVTQWISGLARTASSVFTPPDDPPLIDASTNLTKDVWKQVASNAWRYFQPGVGVDSNTGLPYAQGKAFPYFTDWDLGVYIQTVIDAQKIGLIGTNDTWGSNARLEKAVSFLETRELNTTTNYPYWFYDARTGSDCHLYSDSSTNIVDAVDTGRLFVALNNLRAFNSSLASRINNIVLYGRSNYTALLPSIQVDSATTTSIYAYFAVSGFASFWPNQLGNAPDTILNNMFNAGNVTTYGVQLPKAEITGDPLFCSAFELNNTRVMALAKQVYLAHEAYYNATSEYVAFSEGNCLYDVYVYEWVVTPNGDTWKITAAMTGENMSDMDPIIYNKIAFSFLALYNTTFARNMIIYLEQTLPDPATGYSDGADNSGDQVTMVGGNANGLIMDAALFAIQNDPY